MGSLRVCLIFAAWWALAGLAACGGNGARVPIEIALEGGSPRLPAGIQLDVAAKYVTADLTATAATDVTWSMADAAVATVTPGAGGHATILGVKAGITTLTVTGQGVRDTFTITVTPALLRSIAITPPQPSIAAGTSAQLTATGTFSDLTTMDLSEMVAWSSSATATATVNGTGLVHGIAVGPVTITATVGKVSATVGAIVSPAVLVSIQVVPRVPDLPVDPRLPIGVTEPFSATGVFSDSSTQDLTAQVIWSTDGETHATVDPSGLVTTVGAGTANITASKDGISGSSAVTVTAAVLASIAIEPPAPTLALGLTLQLAATGTFSDSFTLDLTDQVTWASATETVAMVSATGVVTSQLVGTTQITATLRQVSGSTLLTVTPAVAPPARAPVVTMSSDRTGAVEGRQDGR
jgi:uncharacterized protein YjdB